MLKELAVGDDDLKVGGKGMAESWVCMYEGFNGRGILVGKVMSIAELTVCSWV